MARPQKAVARADQAQQRRPPLAIVVATLRKFVDDDGWILASVLAYYAFFTVVPLLLVGATIIGFAGGGTARGGVLERVPLLGRLLAPRGSLEGSAGALAFGVTFTLWAGLRWVRAFELSLDRLWGVPPRERLPWLRATLRGLGFLAAVGAGLLLAMLLSSVAWGETALLAAASAVAAPLVGFAALWFAFRKLTAARVSWASAAPGAAAGAVLSSVVGGLAALYFGRGGGGTQQVFGVLGSVIALLTWLALTSAVILLAAELNVVLAERRWPRSLRERRRRRGRAVRKG